MRMATCHPEMRHKAMGLCDRCYYRDRYKNNPEVRAKARARTVAWSRTHPREWYEKWGRVSYYFNMIERRYGVSRKQYEDIVRQQNGVCAMCGRTSKRRLAIDHDHVGGGLRGLLCLECNTKLGVLEDEQFVSKAVKYLSDRRALDFTYII